MTKFHVGDCVIDTPPGAGESLKGRVADVFTSYSFTSTLYRLHLHGRGRSNKLHTHHNMVLCPGCRECGRGK